MVDWTRFQDLAASTGFIFLMVIAMWCLLAGIIYWAYVSGAMTMKEEVKHRIVADDKPVGFDHTAGGADDGGRKA